MYHNLLCTILPFTLFFGLLGRLRFCSLSQPY